MPLSIYGYQLMDRSKSFFDWMITLMDYGCANFCLWLNGLLTSTILNKKITVCIAVFPLSNSELNERCIITWKQYKWEKKTSWKKNGEPKRKKKEKNPRELNVQKNKMVTSYLVLKCWGIPQAHQVVSTGVGWALQFLTLSIPSSFFIGGLQVRKIFFWLLGSGRLELPKVWILFHLLHSHGHEKVVDNWLMVLNCTVLF